ncbi:hypothetical protein ABH973_007954 [Bradyrhizobium ottawaense]
MLRIAGSAALQSRGTRAECGARSLHRHCDAPMHIPACSVVGWAKAHSAVPTNSIAVREWWARCALSSLWHAAQLANTPSRPRGGFRPSFASTLHPQIQEGAGKAGCQLAPAVRCAKCTRRKNRTAAYRWCRTLGLPCAVVGRLMPCSPGSRVPSGLPRPANWMMQSARLGSLAPSRKLDRSNDGQDHTVLPYAFSVARLHAVSDSQGRPALPATISCRRCRVHRNPARET